MKNSATNSSKLQLTSEELNLYTPFQIEVLNERKTHSYRKIVKNHGFSSCQQLESFLTRTVLGIKLNTTESESGSIPLVPDIISFQFVVTCLDQAISLNCIYTHKSLRILEDLLAERAFRSFQLAHDINYHLIACECIKRLSETFLSSQWFNLYCKDNGIKIVKAQTLEGLRRKF